MFPGSVDRRCRLAAARAVLLRRERVRSHRTAPAESVIVTPWASLAASSLISRQYLAQVARLGRGGAAQNCIEWEGAGPPSTVYGPEPEILL